MKKARASALVLAAATACATLASAQPSRPGSPAPAGASSAPTNIRAHVGTDYVSRLLHSTEPADRIRGIQRAAAIGTTESIAMLVQAMEANTSLRSDPRALIEMARGLARFADQERVRGALLAIVNAGNPGLAGRVSRTAGAVDDGDPVARADLARHVAAIALARSGENRALEQLYAIARSGGSGQSAALAALLLAPPRDVGFYGAANGAGVASSPTVLRALGQLGDLRALDLLHAASRSTDVLIRGAALVALAELGDERAVPLARTAIAETDARLRAAAGEALVLLAAPERFKAITALLADDATVAVGVRLAERVHNADITKLLAARALDHPDRELRAAAIRALGRSPEPTAASILVTPALLADGQLGYLAALALARSPAPNAMALVTTLTNGKSTVGIGARAYVVRALGRGERTSAGDDVLARLAASRDGRERALGVFGRVALGITSTASALDDPDARVRRAAAQASLAIASRATSRALLEHLAVERDESTSQVLGIGLASGDPDAALTTTWLIDRVDGGGPAAALSAYALARRADEGNARKIGQLLGSKDAVLRAHTARGLGAAALADAAGRLADAYAYETDVVARRAIVAALVARTNDASAPARRSTLEMAAQLDPDGPIRQAARLGLAGIVDPLGAALTSEVAWLRITLDGGAAPGDVYVGSLVRSDGVAVPIAFDDDGYALVPGLPPGEARLVLAPRLPSYKAMP